jgi:hypothetical protein
MKILNEDKLGALTKEMRGFCKLYGYQSCDTKRNAQLNLDGRTYYVTDATLRWHKSRIVGAREIAGGLLFKLTTSDALNMENTKRGFRVHVFDLFGTHVWGMDLDQATKRKEQAEKAYTDAEFDILTHYKAALASKRDWFLRDAETYTAALKAIN